MRRLNILGILLLLLSACAPGGGLPVLPADTQHMLTRAARGACYEAVSVVSEGAVDASAGTWSVSDGHPVRARASGCASCVS